MEWNLVCLGEFESGFLFEELPLPTESQIRILIDHPVQFRPEESVLDYLFVGEVQYTKQHKRYETTDIYAVSQTELCVVI